jgi:anti-sigma B factor antagonist
MAEEAVDDGFRIDARRADHDIVLVEIAGDLDMLTVGQAQAFLTQVTAATPRHLILDLTGVNFLASAGIGLLIAAHAGADDIHGRLHLLGVTGNHPVEHPLALVGVLDRFDIAPDLRTLLARLDTNEPLAD